MQEHKLFLFPFLFSALSALETGDVHPISDENMYDNKLKELFDFLFLSMKFPVHFVAKNRISFVPFSFYERYGIFSAG